MIEPLGKSKFMKQLNRTEKDIDSSRGVIEEFWDWMYSDNDGLVQTCSFPVPTENKDAHEMGRGSWTHADSKDEFLEFCTSYSGMWRYHIYSGVNTLDTEPDSGRGGAEDINTVNHISFDIETERESYGGASKEEVWWCYKYALAQVKFIKEEYEQPSDKESLEPMVVMSENGIHLHFKANLDFNDDTRYKKAHIKSKYLTHQAMNSKYAKKIEQDAPDSITFGQDDVSDVPRVMKVPGTRGIKSETGRLCCVIHKPDKTKVDAFTSEDIHVPDEFIEQLDQSSDSSDKEITEVEVTPEDAGSELMTRVKSLCKKEPLFKRLFRGDTSDYDSRSEAEFAFVMKMLNHGFEPSEISQIMWASGMGKWQEETDHYREKTIKEAYSRFDGNQVKDSTNSSFSFSRHTSKSQQ